LFPKEENLRSKRREVDMQAPLQGENSAILVGKELSDQPISPLRIYFAEFTAQNRGIEKQRETRCCT
jgi:hypothetical protein